MNEEEICCGICCVKLKLGEGRDNATPGPICTDCYYPSLLWENAKDDEPFLTGALSDLIVTNTHNL